MSTANALIRQSVRASLKTARRPTDIAVLERYSTIRNFFRSQPISSQPELPRLLPYLARQPRSSRLLTPSHYGTSIHFLSRSFQTSASWANEAKQPPSGAEDGQERSQENPKDEGRTGVIQPKPPHDGPPLLDVELQRYEDYPRLYRRLAMNLPHLHRHTRDDFLNATTGFWQRMRIRFKWLTIRSFRKYNADDISAFITWVIMSQTLWLFIGTTTFFSVLFAILNSLRLQGGYLHTLRGNLLTRATSEYVARAISDYLTSETGITIIFESAIVPKWKDSRISFKNVYVIRRPGSAAALRAKMIPGYAIAAGYDLSNHPSYHGTGDDEDDTVEASASDEDTNYTMFDLSVDSIDVTLSLARWLDGKGLVTDAVIKGVRGVLDRRSVFWDPDHPPDPADYRHPSLPGDFELESLQLEDVLVTVYQPGDFRPYTASIFRADIQCFRKQWLFYDFLSAENVVGQFDNCLFSLHRPQSIGRTTDQDLKDGQWARMSRIRIDGVNVDHLQAMTTQEGPISWITSGKVDAVLDIKFPRDPNDALPLNLFLGEIADAISAAASVAVLERIPGQRELAKPPISAPSDDAEPERQTVEDKPRVIVDIDLRFRDLKAAVPIFTQDISYMNNALIRPIVAFMNAHRTLVPIHCRVMTDLTDFDGAWTMWETGLMDALAIKVYEAMAFHVTQANFNRRIKAVSAWSLQMTASAILAALRSIVHPMATHLREIYETGFPNYPLLSGVAFDAAIAG